MRGAARVTEKAGNFVKVSGVSEAEEDFLSLSLTRRIS
jgi:hypothetical protein